MKIKKKEFKFIEILSLFTLFVLLALFRQYRNNTLNILFIVSYVGAVYTSTFMTYYFVNKKSFSPMPSEKVLGIMLPLNALLLILLSFIFIVVFSLFLG